MEAEDVKGKGQEWIGALPCKAGSSKALAGDHSSEPRRPTGPSASGRWRVDLCFRKQTNSMIENQLVVRMGLFLGRTWFERRMSNERGD